MLTVRQEKGNAPGDQGPLCRCTAPWNQLVVTLGLPRGPPSLNPYIGVPDTFRCGAAGLTPGAWRSKPVINTRAVLVSFDCGQENRAGPVDNPRSGNDQVYKGAE